MLTKRNPDCYMTRRNRGILKTRTVKPICWELSKTTQMGKLNTDPGHTILKLIPRMFRYLHFIEVKISWMPTLPSSLVFWEFHPMMC
ncbi:hypothetical protein SUGI_0264930 [Cryptomeria japonica]|nr:hypothetical protein SUGI_0264930 [Cryptomeria japonica]